MIDVKREDIKQENPHGSAGFLVLKVDGRNTIAAHGSIVGKNRYVDLTVKGILVTARSYKCLFDGTHGCPTH